MKVLRIILLITGITQFLALAGCGKDTYTYTRSNYSICDKIKDHSIFRTLIDEPAVIRQGCFEGIGGMGKMEAFYIDLDSEDGMWPFLFPCENIPEQYRLYGLAVKISCNVLDSMLFPCSAPSAKPIPLYFIRDLSIQLLD